MLARVDTIEGVCRCEKKPIDSHRGTVAARGDGEQLALAPPSSLSGQLSDDEDDRDTIARVTSHRALRRAAFVEGCSPSRASPSRAPSRVMSRLPRAPGRPPPRLASWRPPRESSRARLVSGVRFAEASLLSRARPPRDACRRVASRRGVRAFRPSSRPRRAPRGGQGAVRLGRAHAGIQDVREGAPRGRRPPRDSPRTPVLLHVLQRRLRRRGGRQAVSPRHEPRGTPLRRRHGARPDRDRPGIRPDPSTTHHPSLDNPSPLALRHEANLPLTRGAPSHSHRSSTTV